MNERNACMLIRVCVCESASGESVNTNVRECVCVCMYLCVRCALPMQTLWVQIDDGSVCVNQTIYTTIML